MTLLPSENRNVVGLTGPAFPKYKVGPVCCNPGCSRYADHAHHLWRRSFLGGDFSWVELWDHTILGNLVPLCWRCHTEVTEGRIWMRWDEQHKAVVWDDNTTKYPAQIFPAIKVHGQPEEASVTSHTADGPAAVDTCPGCGQPLKRKKEKGEKLDAPRRRKSWSIAVPADTEEDGALVLDTLLEELRSLFKHPSDKNVRYFTVVQALALVVQNGHLMTQESRKDQ